MCELILFIKIYHNYVTIVEELSERIKNHWLIIIVLRVFYDSTWNSASKWRPQTFWFGQFTDKNNIKFSQMNNNSYCSELKLGITMEIVFV